MDKKTVMVNCDAPHDKEGKRNSKCPFCSGLQAEFVEGDDPELEIVEF